MKLLQRRRNRNQNKQLIEEDDEENESTKPNTKVHIYHSSCSCVSLNNTKKKLFKYNLFILLVMCAIFASNCQIKGSNSHEVIFEYCCPNQEIFVHHFGKLNDAPEIVLVFSILKVIGFSGDF